MSATIVFVCAAPEHASAKRDPAGRNLTVYQRKWAACPAGFSEGHIWVETTGLDYDSLFRKHISEKTVDAPVIGLPTSSNGSLA